MLRIKLWQQAHHHLAIFQHIGHARGCAHIVFQNIKIVLIQTHNINAGNLNINIMRHMPARHQGAKMRIGEDNVGRDGASLQDLLLVINITQEHVQRPHALNEPCLKPCPFAARDHPWNEIKGDQSLAGFLIAINGKGNANAPEHHFRLCTAGGQKLAGRLVQPFLNLRIDSPVPSLGLHHFIKRN